MSSRAGWRAGATFEGFPIPMRGNEWVDSDATRDLLQRVSDPHEG